MKILYILPIALIAATLLSGCSIVNLLNFTIPKSGYAKYSDIAFGEDARQKLDVYVPGHIAQNQPVIVFFYGGSWQSGSKKDYLFVAQALVQKGYIVVIPDYRLYPQVYFPAFMEDAAASVAWVHSNIGHYGGNPDNLFLAGHSAGGYIAAMLAVKKEYIQQAGGNTEWLRGIIGIAAPLDFLPFVDPKIKAIFSHEKDEDTQPIHYVHKGLPPFFLATGLSDTEVYPKNTINFSRKLRNFNVQVTEKHYENTGHIGIVLSLARGFRGRTSLLEDIDAFVKANSK